MSVAVLVVNFRAYDDLGRCLRALDGFLAPGDEVVVVDHESDETQLRRTVAACGRVLPLPRRDNPGFAAGVNFAARHSRAPHLLLLNPDTVLLDPIIRTLEAWLDAHPRTGIAGPRVLNDDGSTQPSARRFPGLSTLFGGRSTWMTRTFPNNWFTRRNLPARSAVEPVEVDWIAGACLMTRRDLFDRLGGLDESFFLYWEDADYCRRAALAGYTAAYLPHVRVKHTGGACAEFALPRAIREFHASAYRCYRKQAGPLGRAVAPLVGLGLRLRGELRLKQALALRRRPSEGIRLPVTTTDDR